MVPAQVSTAEERPFVLEPPSVEAETAYLASLTESIEDWFASPRFAGIRRPYGASLVASKRGTVPVSPLAPANVQAQKLCALLSSAAAQGKPLLTMGALDPVQQSQMAHHLPVVYVSGWAASSTFVPGTNEVGPDLADYPYNTVPSQVERLSKAQRLHDRKHWDERCQMSAEQKANTPWVDYLKPIIADGDTGHGGLSSVIKMAKAFGDAGVSAVHFEDQLHGGKKCGHQAGKVLVPMGEHVSRMIAARMQWDIMGLETLAIARTDAESAKLISSTADVRDHEFVLGVETGATSGNGTKRPLSEEIAEAEASGCSGAEIDRIEKTWMDSVQLVTFDKAVENAFSRAGRSAADLDAYRKHVRTHALSQRASAVYAASLLGQEVGWDWDLPRTREGYYHYQGGVPAALKRVLAYAPHADLLWLETKTPDLGQARGFAGQIHEQFPGKWLVYNLSPSFNWSAHGFSDDDLRNFVWDLGRAGFVLQLISLAGLHSTATMTAELAARFKNDGMLAYVELVQRKEKQLGCDVLTHQRWSGSLYVDRILNAISAGSSGTAASGSGSTEESFH